MLCPKFTPNNRITVEDNAKSGLVTQMSLQNELVSLPVTHSVNIPSGTKTAQRVLILLPYQQAGSLIHLPVLATQAKW